MTRSPMPPRRVARIDLTVGPPLVLEPERRAAVAAHFATLGAANPKLWNGPFFLFEDVAIDDAAFVATGRPTDYATFLHWRAQGFPGGSRTHVFPVPAITTSDRRLLVGVMGTSTSNAGLTYPPSGSFDHDDRVGDRIDPVANMVRELREEVGIDAATLEPEAGFTVLDSGPGRMALVKRWRTGADAATLAAEIVEHLGREVDPELGGFDFLPFDRRLAADETVPYVNTLLGLLEESG